MLNSILVEQFGSINRQQLSGVLTVVSDDLRLRFCFENGDPVALDFCTDKDLVLAHSLLEFHKIGPEMHQIVVEAHKLGKGNVAEMLKRQQQVSDDEIGQVTRAMVEDTLVKCFGSPHQELVFDERDDAGTFDFENSAIRLRIATSILLNTVQSRVAEVDRVMSVIGAGNAVFSLCEYDAGAVTLTDFEKHILGAMDGRKTVDDFAVAFRESTLSMARMLCSMADRGVIKRTSLGGASRMRATAQPDAPLGSAAASQSAVQSMPDFVPHHAAPEQGSNMALRVVLVATLALVSFVGYLAYEGARRSTALDSSAQEFLDQLTARKWADAETKIKASREEAGNDIVAIERVDRLEKKFEDAVAREIQQIQTMVEEEDYLQASTRIQALPLSLQPLDLRNKILTAELEFQKNSDAVLKEVTELLVNDNAVQAMQVISNNPGRISDAASEHLQRWRVSSLERAASSSLPLSLRSALVNQILATDPPNHQRDQIERIKADFGRMQQRTMDMVKDLAVLAKEGAFKEVEKEYEAQRLGDQLKGTPLASEAASLKTLNDSTANELLGLEQAGVELLTNGEEPKEFSAFGEKVKEALAKWPKASNAATLNEIAELLTEISLFTVDRQANEEANAIDVWLQETQPSEKILELVKQRTERLRSSEKSAQQALETARGFARQQAWDTNKRLLEEILDRSEWKRTDAYTLAKQDLESIDSLRSQQEAWSGELKEAMLAGDRERSHEIAQRMGLRYLPLTIHSTPSGAEVLRDGNVVGTTPCIMEIPAGERAELELELRKPTFDSVVVPAAQAEGGWFLDVQLERTRSAHVELGMTVTAQPTVIGKQLWVASRQQAAVIENEKETKRHSFEHPGSATAIGTPLYAGAVSAGGNIYYATRDGVVIRIGADGIVRLPIPTRSDLAIASYASEFIVDRRYIIVAGTDGILYGCDEETDLTVWKGPQGSPFSCPPIVAKDCILTIRTNGEYERYSPDDGKQIAQGHFDGPVLHAWADGDGISAITTLSRWHVSAAGEPVREELPFEAQVAGQDVFITADKQVHIKTETAWQHVGKLDGKSTASPIAWHGHAVIPCGKTMHVIGAEGFIINNADYYLAPIIVEDKLAVITAGGDVSFFAPQ